jgi:signal transduction histidine kinase/DNA-binding response OmpR family regulator
MQTPAEPHRSMVASSLLLMAGAIVLNIVLGQIVQRVLQLPLYLDSVGTILIAALLGPLAGSIAGALSNLIWGVVFSVPQIMPFAITAAVIGWAAGLAVSMGAFANIWRVLGAGALIGVLAALVSAPIAAYVFGGTTGVGTDQLTSYFQATSKNVLQAVTVQGLLADPLDKTLSFLIAWLIWQRTHAQLAPISNLAMRPFRMLSGYWLAFVACAVVSAVAWVFLPAFGVSIFSLFYIVVTVSALRGGLGPAIFATVLSVILMHVIAYLGGEQTFASAQWWLIVMVFVAVSLFTAMITAAREKAARALAESEARTRAITDSVAEALTLVSPEGRVVAVNRTFSEMFGVPADRVVDQPVQDVRAIAEHVFAEPESVFEALAAGGNGQVADTSENEPAPVVEQVWPAHRELQIRARSVALNDSPLGRLFVFRDVTHEREVDRMKTEFVGLVSHELRTPLTSIKGFTDMVLDGDAGEIEEEAREYLGIVKSNADRLVALVNDLLDISRLESGRVQMKIEDVDLAEVITLVTRTLGEMIAEKDQTLTVDVDPALPAVRADRDKTIQIVTNYVSNAYKYTPAGGDIHVEVTRVDTHARIAVTDTGYGIAPEDQERLFTRFYRVDNSKTREIGGTGLGLSIVKSFVELQGGEVDVESEVGKGSTFSFTVPLSEVTASTVSAPPADGEVVDTPVPGASILLVEDDPDIARLIATQLEQAGYETDTVTSAEEALDQLRIVLPDLITVDVRLPGMDGFALIERLSADPRTRDIPVLVITVHDDDPRGMRLGVTMLPKPIDQGELLSTVASMLHDADTTSRGGVLIIEDDADDRRKLGAELEKHGLDVIEAADCEAGLAASRQHQPGVILIDLRLPNLSDLAILRALHESPETASIPVIMMTGSDAIRTEVRARALAMGAADLVQRPIDLDMLVAEIRAFMTARGG